MTDYRAELERLDEQWGRVHTLADCSVAYKKSTNTPELLDDRDLTLIGFVHGDTGVTDARLRQMKSRNAIAEAHAPMSTGIPVETKSAETKAPTMTKAELATIAEGFAKGMKPVFENYKTKIAALEARVALLEEKPSINFRGVFEAGKSYVPGDAVTCHGGLWICRAETVGPPSHGPKRNALSGKAAARKIMWPRSSTICHSGALARTWGCGVIILQHIRLDVVCLAPR